VIRATPQEKALQIEGVEALYERYPGLIQEMLERLKETAASGGNVFSVLMEAAKVCSLGQITHALYEVGGEYRRNM
jgi:methylmalonyl-CoA mutase